jgi:hypothetical protein
MIYIEPKEMGWDPIYKSWINTLPEGFDEPQFKVIDDLIHWLIPP